MRLVKWQDRHGQWHASWLRDQDPDDLAHAGIPHDPPDLNKIDWEEVKQEIHNQFVIKGLFTWPDVIQQQTAVTNIVQSVVKRRLISLFKQQEVTNE